MCSLVYHKGLHWDHFWFWWYMDTISSIELSSGTKILYTDDILGYKPIVGNFSFCGLQQDIDMIFEWSKANYLKFNMPKCKCMLLTHNRNPYHSTLKLDGVSLQFVTQYAQISWFNNFLNLHWASHINHICSNARKYLGLIYKNFANNISNPTSYPSMSLSSTCLTITWICISGLGYVSIKWH